MTIAVRPPATEASDELHVDSFYAGPQTEFDAENPMHAGHAESAPGGTGDPEVHFEEVFPERPASFSAVNPMRAGDAESVPGGGVAPPFVESSGSAASP